MTCSIVICRYIHILLINPPIYSVVLFIFLMSDDGRWEYLICDHCLLYFMLFHRLSLSTVLYLEMVLGTMVVGRVQNQGAGDFKATHTEVCVQIEANNL